MDERLSRRIVGHSIPEYMIEILIQDYAGTFLRMVVSRNGGVYDLSYEQNGYRRCMAQRLPSPEKFRLLELLYDINEENENHLIPAERYMLEPELIYWKDHRISRKTVRLLFYPDVKGESFLRKWLMLIEKILNPGVPEEKGLLEQMRYLLQKSSDPEKLRDLIQAARIRCEGPAEE